MCLSYSSRVQTGRGRSVLNLIKHSIFRCKFNTIGDIGGYL